MPEELTQEDVFLNDVDPLDGIRALRKEEGVADEDLPPAPDSADVTDTVIEEDTSELDAVLPDADPAPEPDSEPVADADPVIEPTSDEVITDETQNEEEDPEKDTPAKTPVDLYKFKAHGQDFEFTQAEVLEQFGTVFGQAMDYTQKMQKIAPYRKMISALEEEGLSQTQLNTAIDALKGNKDALKEILKLHEMDTFDLEDSATDGKTDPYTPTDYGKDDFQLQLDEITNTISQDPEYKITVDVIDNQWDQNSRDTFSKHPKLITGLHNDIKTGLYDKVAPRAMKIKVLDGNSKSDIEYYMLAGEQVRLEEQSNSQQTVDDTNQQTQDAVDSSDQASLEAQRKRSASSTRTRADRKGVIDYLEDDDEAFDVWYQKLQASN